MKHAVFCLFTTTPVPSAVYNYSVPPGEIGGLRLKTQVNPRLQTDSMVRLNGDAKQLLTPASYVYIMAAPGDYLRRKPIQPERVA